jgi:hypothetical protein
MGMEGAAGRLVDEGGRHVRESLWWEGSRCSGILWVLRLWSAGGNEAGASQARGW